MRPLDEIERSAAKAAPGPWVECAESGEWWMETESLAGDRTVIIPDTGACMEQYDVDFIVAARTDVPEMAAEIRQLRDLIRDLTTMLTNREA